jgi:hypothetical protein
MDEATRADMAQWTGCIAGALTREEFARALSDAALVDVDIQETHRAHRAATSAIVRARKPDPPCCDSDAQAGCCKPAAKSECCNETAGGGCGCATA